MTDSLAAELATAPCIVNDLSSALCVDERFKHPECQAAHLEALRRDDPAKLAELLGMREVAKGHTVRPLYAFTPSEASMSGFRSSRQVLSLFGLKIRIVPVFDISGKRCAVEWDVSRGRFGAVGPTPWTAYRRMRRLSS